MTKKLNDQKKKDGTITVLLSLTLFLILAFVLTMLESARIGTAKTFAQRALYQSMDSVLAEYYSPLLEEYHILGYHAGDGGEVEHGSMLADKLKEYMSYTFTPNKGLDKFYVREGKELYDITTDSLTLEDLTYLGDYEGKLFMHEATEYMKYKKVTDVVEQVLNHFSLLKTPQKVSYVFDKKQKVEQKLVEIDRNMLKLMEYLDGIKTGKNGIETNKRNQIKVQASFVKKLCYGPVTMGKVNINNDAVYSVLQSHYVDPVPILNKMEEGLKEINLIEKREKELEADIINLEQSISSIHDNLYQLNQISPKSKSIKNQIAREEERLQTVSQSLTNVYQSLNLLTQRKNDWIHTMQFNITTLKNLAEHIIPCINKALPVLEELIGKADQVKFLLKDYEELLHREREGIGQEIYGELVKDLGEMKRYGNEEMGYAYNFTEWRSILVKNKNIVSQLIAKLEQCERELVLGGFAAVEGTLTDANSIVSNYSITGLGIDYSTIILDKDDQEDVINHLKSLIEEGLISLVIDPNVISKQEIGDEVLPSKTVAFYNESGLQFDFLSLIDFLENDKKNEGAGSFFQEFGNDSMTLSAVSDGIDLVLKKFLLNGYMIEHFETYETDLTGRKPSALQYEIEYLLSGKTDDKENFQSVVTKIILIRTLLNFVSILGNKEISNEAKIMAASIVGFTGLPALISVIKVVLLIFCALGEALIDTAALLMEKKVPLIKTNSDIIMRLPDLLCLSRPFILEKANDSKDNTRLGVSYVDFLKLFLFLKDNREMTYRAMDIIQENIRLRYEDDFRIQHCLYGFKARATFEIPYRFVNFNFVQKLVSPSEEGYYYNVSESYSY